jgi:hypothetical protein
LFQVFSVVFGVVGLVFDIFDIGVWFMLCLLFLILWICCLFESVLVDFVFTVRWFCCYL